MTRFFSRTLSVLVLLLTTNVAFAVTLQEAKQQGLVGEQRDGYIGLVQANVPGEIMTLVNQVNEERRERYEQIARENSISMAQVTTLAYERAMQATQPGHYLQLPNGAWVKK